MSFMVTRPDSSPLTGALAFELLLDLSLNPLHLLENANRGYSHKLITIKSL